MDSMESKDILSWLAIVVTCGVNLCGIFICRDIKKNNSTQGISPLPFFTAFMCSSLWLSYGLNVQDGTLCIVNGTGAALQVIYIAFYLHMASYKGEVIKKVLFTAATLLVLLFIAHFFAQNHVQVANTLGYMSSIASILFMASPLSNIVIVIRARSTESMPFPLILTLFIMSFLWFLYGIVISDTFVQVPNLIGTCITAFQLLLFVIFPTQSKLQFNI